MEQHSHPSLDTSIPAMYRRFVQYHLVEMGELLVAQLQPPDFVGDTTLVICRSGDIRGDGLVLTQIQMNRPVIRHILWPNYALLRVSTWVLENFPLPLVTQQWQRARTSAGACVVLLSAGHAVPFIVHNPSIAPS